MALNPGVEVVRLSGDLNPRFVQVWKRERQCLMTVFLTNTYSVDVYDTRSEQMTNESALSNLEAALCYFARTQSTSGKQTKAKK